MALHLHGEAVVGVPAGVGHPLLMESPKPAGSSSLQGSVFPGVDALTAADMKRLIERKEAAVQAENYDEAKEIKSELDCLRLVGAKILELETR